MNKKAELAQCQHLRLQSQRSWVQIPLGADRIGGGEIRGGECFGVGDRVCDRISDVGVNGLKFIIASFDETFKRVFQKKY